MKYFFAFILLAIFSLLPQKAFSWGLRGHASICEAAVFLVDNKELKEFLQDRPQVMGHLCNIPDIYWKSLPSQFTKEGNPAHYINAEPLGLTVKDMPTDFKQILEKYNNAPRADKPNNEKFLSLPHDIGSNWWRANQFYNMSIDVGKKIKSAAVPKNSKEEQDENLPYNLNTYTMMTFMGVMGHFVGDNSQPFHVTSNHDGYNTGNGGIHSYYEEAAVNILGPSLQNQIYLKALEYKKKPKLKAFVLKKTTLEKMKALAEISESEIAEVLKLDPLITKSNIKLEKGNSIKIPAVRRPVDSAGKNFTQMIIRQQARSALLLATLWDEIYEQIDKPDLKNYKSFKYPFTVDFIYPDYYPTKK